MNILQFITPAGLYGAEMWILALARNLNPEKVNCSLAVSCESESQNLEICERYEALGLDAYKLKMKGKFDPLVILRLVKLIKRKRIDILHTHGYKSDLIGIVAGRIAGIKVIATPHGFENSADRKLRMFIKLGTMSFRCFDRVVPLSEELKSDVMGFRVPSEKIRLIKNGVDLLEISTELKSHDSKAFADSVEKNIGYVGQLASRKNVGDLIKTFDLLFEEHKNIRLILIGDGPMREALEKYARSLRSSDQIDFLGYRENRLKIVNKLDLFCMTSSLEGIPRCMMEAMAMGKPVAAFNIPGVDKLIIDGKTGLMAEFGDVPGLKECLKRLLFNQKLADEFAQNGQAHIHKNYSAHRMASEYEKLYFALQNQ